MRSDRYPQGQGIVSEDGQSALGHFWYQTEMNLTPGQLSSNLHIMFPGLFNGMAYVNGDLVSHRNFVEPWYLNDYKFEWDVDLNRSLRPGRTSSPCQASTRTTSGFFGARSSI